MRFVVISLPSPDVCRTIEEIRRPVNQRFGCRQALRYPPHITLRTGLVCPDDRSDEVAEAFLAHAGGGRSFSAETAGLFFTTYGVPEVGMVAWSVARTEELMELHHRLLRFTAWQKGPQSPFQPHLSLAYGDLTPTDLTQLRNEGGLQASPDFRWTVDHVALYHETPEGWIEWGQSPLGS